MVEQELRTARKNEGSHSDDQEGVCFIRTGRRILHFSMVYRRLLQHTHPLNQLTSISVPEPECWCSSHDKSAIGNIEKAILKSDWTNPSSDGNVIRISIPHLTEERRRDLVKVVRKKAEEMRVAVRNVRRDTNETLKKMEKNKSISEDELKIALEGVQELTDKYVSEVDELLKRKEQEIMEV